MKIYVDIDNNICSTEGSDYPNSTPRYDQIKKINKLYDEGNQIIYWTARGGNSGIDWLDLTADQLDEWGCLYHELSVGNKPSYDLLICDKTKRIEEI
jgi:hypothetical protein